MENLQEKKKKAPLDFSQYAEQLKTYLAFMGNTKNWQVI